MAQKRKKLRVYEVEATITNISRPRKSDRWTGDYYRIDWSFTLPQHGGQTGFTHVGRNFRNYDLWKDLVNSSSKGDRFRVCINEDHHKHNQLNDRTDWNIDADLKPIAVQGMFFQLFAV